MSPTPKARLKPALLLVPVSAKQKADRYKYQPWYVKAYRQTMWAFLPYEIGWFLVTSKKFPPALKLTFRECIFMAIEMVKIRQGLWKTPEEAFGTEFRGLELQSLSTNTSITLDPTSGTNKTLN